MEKITQEEIDSEFKTWSENNSDYSVDAFEAGVKFAESKLEPKWIPCKQKDVLPHGKYLLKLQNGILYSMDKYIEIPKGGREIPYFYVTHYFKIETPIYEHRD